MNHEISAFLFNLVQEIKSQLEGKELKYNGALVKHISKKELDLVIKLEIKED